MRTKGKKWRSTTTKLRHLSFACESAQCTGQTIAFQQKETAEIKNRIRVAWASFHRHQQELCFFSCLQSNLLLQFRLCESLHRCLSCKKCRCLGCNLLATICSFFIFLVPAKLSFILVFSLCCTKRRLCLGSTILMTAKAVERMTAAKIPCWI